MILTAENYFSFENQLNFTGASQFKDFMFCEAGAMAKIRGEYAEEMSVSLLVGSYVDAYFDGTLGLFKAKHPELFTKQGELKADFRRAEIIIQRIERDPLFLWALDGDKQKIVTGKIAGVPFKGKIDVLHPAEAIVDLKIMRDFAPVWVEGKGKINFVDAWGYDIQGAIYRELEGNHLPFIIAAATKESPEPDIAVMSVSHEVLDLALGTVRELAPRYQSIKRGDVTPHRCEHCDYCKSTKQLIGVVDYREVGK